MFCQSFPIVRAAIKISFAIFALTGIGFCVAYLMDEALHRTMDGRVGRGVAESRSDDLESPDAPLSESGTEATSGEIVTVPETGVEAALADRLLAESSLRAELRLLDAVGELETNELEDMFVELMARDLEDGGAVTYAGHVLRELAARSPEAAVALLYALPPAEKEKLVASVAEGWVASEPDQAFEWIESAWVDAEGGFIDRSLQNELYIQAMDTLVADPENFALAGRYVDRVADPALKQQLVKLVARRVVQNGPEAALERLAGSESAVFDTAVMDAIAEEWAARDEVGAMAWTLSNEEEVSPTGVRSIAKQLSLRADDASLRQFHQNLETTARRDSVAAEAARLAARRDPIASADWALAIAEPSAKREAVLEALYEIGYENFEQSVDYVDVVYPPHEPDRVPVLYTTLKEWMPIDRSAVATYLESGRARLPDGVAEEILLTR